MRRRLGRVACVAVAIAAATPLQAHAQDRGTAHMSVDHYLMERAYEVALARSAAPDAVSDDATVLVLTPSGYEVAVAGTNGFTCLVERSWSSPFGPHRDFYNPRLRAPICYNAAASTSTLTEYLRRTELALEGKSWDEVRDGVTADIVTGRLKAPTGLAMSYMLSDAQLLGSETGRFMPHLMFYVPYATGTDLGTGPDNPHAMFFEYEGGPFSAFIVPATEWIAGPAGR